jgi:putative transposase
VSKEEIVWEIRKYLGSMFRELVRQKECEILKGQMVQDHVHILIPIPPKYSVSQITQYIKRKSAIAVGRQFRGRKRNFNGEHFLASWARCIGSKRRRIKD